jgi:hypothetical protein
MRPSEDSVKAKFAEIYFPEFSEDDLLGLLTSTCQGAPSVSRARNRSTDVLGNREICGLRALTVEAPDEPIHR